MCLYTKQICPLRARKDIVCYKKFYVWSSSMQTFYRNIWIAKPKENHPTLMDDTDVPLCIQRYKSLIRSGVKSQIWKGMIYAYKTKPKYICTNASKYPRTGLYKFTVKFAII